MCVMIKKTTCFFACFVIIFIVFGLLMSGASSKSIQTRFNANNSSLSVIYGKNENIKHQSRKHVKCSLCDKKIKLNKLDDHCRSIHEKERQNSEFIRYKELIKIDDEYKWSIDKKYAIHI